MKYISILVNFEASAYFHVEFGLVDFVWGLGHVSLLLLSVMRRVYWISGSAGCKWSFVDDGSSNRAVFLRRTACALIVSGYLGFGNWSQCNDDRV